MQNEYYDPANLEKWLIEELNPATDGLIIPHKDIKALISDDGTLLQINLPNMMILCPINPYLEAAMELQLVEDERKVDFREGILGLVRMAIYLD